MLVSNLLRAKAVRGKVYPIYAPLNAGTLGLAERMSAAFNASIGGKKGHLVEKLKVFEDEGFDYKLVRGLRAILERRCVFEPDSPLNPREVRTLVFEEASRARAVTEEDRSKVIQGVASNLKVDSNTLEKTLYGDVENELVLREFEPMVADALIRYYNFSLVQTLLFKSLRMEFSASGNWKNIFRSVKWLGLMYSVERDQEGGYYTISIDGPLSLFKMTDRYGTSMAKLLPHITASERWNLKADILAKNKTRIYTFEVESSQAKGIMEDLLGEQFATPQVYDSSVEERFARRFNECDTGWALRREPEPLLAGKYVLIPDFGFEKYGLKVYLEVLGFWTQEYLERKISKLNSVVNVDMLIAADETLACSKLDKLGARGKNKKIIYYTKDVPIKPILEHLKDLEDRAIEHETGSLTIEHIEPKGDIIRIEDIAEQYGVSTESMRRALKTLDVEGYKRVGGLFVSNSKIAELEQRISQLDDKAGKLGEASLSDAINIVEKYDLGSPLQVLESLGYAILWEGLDYDKSTIRKKESFAQ